MKKRKRGWERKVIAGGKEANDEEVENEENDDVWGRIHFNGWMN